MVFLNLMSPNINSFVPIDTSNELLIFAVDIQSQAKVRKPTIALWLPGGHFETDITQNQPYLLIRTRVMCYRSLELILQK